MTEVDQNTKFLYDKLAMLQELNDIFNQWDGLLASVDETNANLKLPSSDWTIKDVAAHLMAWQQVTNARVQAAVNQTEPKFPGWLGGSSPESEEEINNFNARIKQQYRASSWAEVYQMWRSGFSGLINLVEAIPEADLMDEQKYPWLHGYPLMAVLYGTLDHHQEHLEWFR